MDYTDTTKLIAHCRSGSETAVERLVNDYKTASSGWPFLCWTMRGPLVFLLSGSGQLVRISS